MSIHGKLHRPVPARNYLWQGYNSLCREKMKAKTVKLMILRCQNFEMLHLELWLKLMEDNFVFWKTSHPEYSILPRRDFDILFLVNLFRCQI